MNNKDSILTFTINKRLSEVEELKSVVEGPYTLKVVQAEVLPPKEEGQSHRLNVEFDIVDHDALSIYHNFWLPNPNDNAKQRNRAEIALRNFFIAFNMDPDAGNYNCMEWGGLLGNVTLEQVAKGYGDNPDMLVNKITNFVTSA